MEVLIAIALVAIAVGVWWVALSRCPAPPPPAPAPAPTPGPVSLLPPDLQEELEEAARDRREAFAEWRAARMRREARDARAEASATSTTSSTGDSGTPSTTSSRPSGPTLRPPRQAPAAGGAAARPWGERHLALPGEVARFVVAAADRTAAVSHEVDLVVESQRKGETEFRLATCGTVVKDGNVRDHIVHCPACKTAYGLK